MNELHRRKLYREAFALLERAQKLLLNARKRHEAEAAKALQKAA